MFHANNEKQKTTNDGRSRTTKSIKNQNAQRKENLEIIGNTGSRHHQTCGDERKNKKKNTSRERENYSKPNYIAEISLKGAPLIRYLGPFLKWMREELQLMDLRIRKLMTMHKALHLRNDVDSICQEKNDEEDLKVFKIILMHLESD